MRKCKVWDKGLRLGNQALGLWRLQGMMSLFCIKRIDKDMIGLGQGAQIGKSYSRTLEDPRHELMTL